MLMFVWPAGILNVPPFTAAQVGFVVLGKLDTVQAL
jgi:hypothetical protein